MPPKRNPRALRNQIDREIRQLDSERARLVAARAALDGELVLPKERKPRISQDDVAAYLAEHPDSTYTQVAEALDASPVNVAAHLSRGQKAERFLNRNGKWSVR